MIIKDYMIDIIDVLNSGQTINATDFAKAYKLNRRTIVNYLNSLKECLNLRSLENKRGEWRIRSGFLKHIGLTSEEVAVYINLELSSKESINKISIAKSTIGSFYRENKQIIDQNIELEKLSSTMAISIQKIEEAIERKKKVEILFKGHYRFIQPFKIFRREHYWYFAGYEEYKREQHNEENAVISDLMKTYSLNTIRAVVIIEGEHVTHDFTNAEIILNHSLNAFMTWENKPVDVELLIKSHLSNKIRRIELYNHWIKIGPSSTLEGYDIYKTKSVHSEFKDIIPTILKYSPDIIITKPLKLSELIYKRVSTLYYSKFT